MEESPVRGAKPADPQICASQAQIWRPQQSRRAQGGKKKKSGVVAIVSSRLVSCRGGDGTGEKTPAKECIFGQAATGRTARPALAYVKDWRRRIFAIGQRGRMVGAAQGRDRCVWVLEENLEPRDEFWAGSQASRECSYAKLHR